MTDVLDELAWRGLIALSTDEEALRKALVTGPVTLYCGFDPTAPGLHIGNLVQLLTVARFQRAGNRPIGLVGGATGLIGDPSGKSAERVLNPREVVADWVERIRREVARFLDFGGGPTSAQMVSNLDWTGSMPTLDFLRDIGKHFSVNQMIARESVKARLESGGISYTEFSYQVLQALDYLELYRRYGCTLQTGGSDQWGNLVAGVDLIRRVEGASVHALATPLITKPDGTKYGKTASGADLAEPRADEPVRVLPVLVQCGGRRSGKAPAGVHFPYAGGDPRARGRGRAAAGRTCGAASAGRGRHHARARSGGMPAGGWRRAALCSARATLRGLDERTLAAALAEVPKHVVTVGRDGQLPPLVDLLADTGIVASKSAARRAIAEGGAYLNNRKVTDENARPDRATCCIGRFLVLRRGKRTVGGVEVVPA